jgi:hypothetical protein
MTDNILSYFTNGINTKNELIKYKQIINPNTNEILIIYTDYELIWTPDEYNILWTHNNLINKINYYDKNIEKSIIFSENKKRRFLKTNDKKWVYSLFERKIDDNIKIYCYFDCKSYFFKNAIGYEINSDLRWYVIKYYNMKKYHIIMYHKDYRHIFYYKNLIIVPNKYEYIYCSKIFILLI